jgi:hypothetical protein
MRLWLLTFKGVGCRGRSPPASVVLARPALPIESGVGNLCFCKRVLQDNNRRARRLTREGLACPSRPP